LSYLPNKEREMFEKAAKSNAWRCSTHTALLDYHCVPGFLYDLAPTSRKMLNEPYFKAKLFKSFYYCCLIAKMPLFFKGFPNQT